MREIKFRAWDEKREVMHQEFNFIQSHGDGHNWIVPIKHLSDPTWMEDIENSIQEMPHERRQFKLMQYTGLKDKNGVEIYEGDILAICDDLRLTSVVEYKHCGFVMKHTKHSARKRFINGHNEEPIFHNSEIALTVVGNIHENKELLTEPSDVEGV